MYFLFPFQVSYLYSGGNDCNYSDRCAKFREMILRYQSFGQGEPLVILHGLFGSSDNWRTIARSLENRFQTILPDARNHGLSFRDPVMNYEAMADDLKKLLEHLNLSKIILLGHSMGGKTAMAFAVRYPEQIKKLIVVDIALKESRHHDHIFKAWRDGNLNEISDIRERQFIAKSIKKTDFDALEKNYSTLAGVPNLSGNFNEPTLWIRGEKSDYVLDEDWSKIQARFPKAELATISGAGHWVHADAPEEFLKLIGQV